MKIMAKSKFHKFFEVLKDVVRDPNTVVLTDNELRVLVNSKLDTKDHVARSTFEFWRHHKDGVRSLENNKSVTDEEVKEFRQIIDLARVGQKMALGACMLDEKNKNQWGASWILERKFEDMKLKQTVELGGKTTNIQITVGNKDHKGLIEGLLQGETLDIPHEEVKPERRSLNE